MAGGGEHEVNLVPYLDIVVTLTVAFLVLTLEVTALAQTPVDAPPTGPPGSGEGGLAVVIGEDGFTLRSGDDAVRLPRGDDGAWPYARLTEALHGLRDAGETSAHLRVAPEKAIPYSVVIATMDAARNDGAVPLYPGVSLALPVASR